MSTRIALGAAAALAGLAALGARGSRSVGGLSTAEKIQRLRSARDRMQAISPEFFEGSCSHTSLDLWWLARLAGWSGVVLWVGTADPPDFTGEPGTDHVWLEVDGVRFDPTWEFTLGDDVSQARYNGEPVDFDEDPGALSYFTGDDVYLDDPPDLSREHREILSGMGRP